MTYVVTAACFGCKNTECVAVCPCDCFHEGEQMLYIDPHECIDCGACREECPTQAIFPDDEVPEAMKEFIALNEEMSQIRPSIFETKPPL